ncbi:MAG TPA: hypothetical protein VG755_29635, partial [Nannocystaceae bacterium]|nr:hypothetical protein [Nannocystaceae bacterium]
MAELVEEVARNLRGLGFDVDVVCGAEARSALLGRNDRRDEPTIYVVCVQGTLKEQVLKPLRQALATHGGPNQHLFVAVLDLGLPLAMVGQIRRFAEALERPGGKGGAINERRQWREHVGPNGPDRVPTRAYRAVEMLERTTGSHPSVDATTTTRTGPQAVIGSARPTKVGVTAKYRAVTGQLPTVSGETESVADASTSGRRRRKTHAPKVRVKPIAPARTRRGRTEPPIEGGVAMAPVESAASPSTEEDDPSAELRAPVPAADIEASMSASWGVEEDDTIVHTRAPDPVAPPPVPARTGDTVIAAAPSSPPSEERAPAKRSETVLYTEGGDQPVLLPLPPPDPPSATARGNTVIGQAPTRFRATPVAPVPREGRTMIGITPPTVKPDERDAATARGETVVAPPPAAPTVRGDTAVGPPPSAPTLRGDTVVGPPPSVSPPSSSPTARGDTVVASSTPTAPVFTPPPAPVFTPPPSSSPTARGDTVVAPPRSSTAPPSATGRGDTVFLPPSSSPTARGDA